MKTLSWKVLLLSILFAFSVGCLAATHPNNRKASVATTSAKYYHHTKTKKRIVKRTPKKFQPVQKHYAVKKVTAKKATPITVHSIATLPPLTKSKDYIVKKDDTLYSIAFSHNIDVQDLASMNNITSPYTIKVGQKLLLDPQDSQIVRYRVKPKDTMFSLAKRFNIELDQLAQQNNIGKNCDIRVGQWLIIGRKYKNEPLNITPINNQVIASKVDNIAPSTQPNDNKPKVVIATNETVKTIEVPKTSAVKTPEPKVVSEPVKTSAPKVAEVKVTKPTTSNTTVANNKTTTKKDGQNVAIFAHKIKWQWPNDGKIIEGYTRGEHGNKGIDFGGQRGNQVRSAAAGKIVYAGNALRGYGNLIIINHNDDYLSAYAHNDDILVAEGQTVRSGQTIARMGDTDSSNVRLHFEIRYRGESVNPLNYLPKR